MLLGIVFGLLSLKFQKGCTIFATSMIGGALMISCIDYFIEHLALLSYIWERVRDVPSASLCWYSWVIMGCWDFCIIVGSITQWKITGRGYDHREGESTIWLLVKRWNNDKTIPIFDFIVKNQGVFVKHYSMPPPPPWQQSQKSFF